MNENILYSEVIKFLKLYILKGEKIGAKTRNQEASKTRIRKQGMQTHDRGKKWSHDDGERKFQDNSWSRNQSVETGAEGSRKDILRKRQVDRLLIFSGATYL